MDNTESKALGCATLIFILIVAYAAIRIFIPSDGDRQTTRVASVDETDAFIWCKDHVRDRLKSPATAKFPFVEFSHRDLGNNTWRIISYVDSQNSFGALVRTNWACEIQYSNGAWQLQDLTLSGQ